jgi:hypothetical protein
MRHMEPDEILQRKGLQVRVFVPPPTPPWRWTNLGFGPPAWIPPTPGGLCMNVMDILQAVPAGEEVSRATISVLADLLARERGLAPSGEPLRESLLDTPQYPKIVAEVRPVNRLFSESNGPTVMPRLPWLTPHHGYGRPRIEDRRPNRVIRLAWLRDLCDHDTTRRLGARLSRGRAQWSYKALARALYGDDDDKNLKMVIREVGSGRNALNERGVIPWVSWQSGHLPTTWWHQSAFRRALMAWSVCAAVTSGPGFEAVAADQELNNAISQVIAQAGDPSHFGTTTDP